MQPIYNKHSRSPILIETSASRKTTGSSVSSTAHLSQASTNCGTPSPAKNGPLKNNGILSPASVSSKFSDIIMKDTGFKATTTSEMIEPINLVANQQLGEPDPTAISKHDLLSSIAFDRSGEILSVGDSGGRIICFKLTEIENSGGQKEFDYFTEF